MLYSEERITQYSQEYRDGYRTEIRIDYLEDIFEVKMYAIYKGNTYEVQTVSPRLKELELLARKGYEKEDKEIGFKDNINERVTHILLTREEVENIYVKKRSVYGTLKPLIEGGVENDY